MSRYLLRIITILVSFVIICFINPTPFPSILVSAQDPTPFLYRPFEQSNAKITSFLDHSCPVYGSESSSQKNKIIIFSGHTLSDSCKSYDPQGNDVPNCGGSVKSFTNNLWELPRLYYSGHDGFDFAAAEGSRVLAAARGLVTKVYNRHYID